MFRTAAFRIATLVSSLFAAGSGSSADAADPLPLDFAQVAGNYFSTFSSEADSVSPIHAAFKLTLGVAGTASGSVRINGHTLAFKTEFDAIGHANVNLEVRGESRSLIFDLIPTQNGPLLAGRLESEGVSLNFTGLRAVNSATAGRHVFLIHTHYPDPNIPPVAGFGAFTISNKGNVRVAGRLLLSGPVSQSAMVLEDGSIAVDLATDRGGFVNGTVTPAQRFDSEWAGSLHWFRPAGRPTARFAQEIDTDLDLTATRHTVTRPPLPASDVETPLVIELQGGGLESSQFLSGRMILSGLILPPLTWRYTIGYIDPLTGFVRGTFVDPETQRRVVLHGVVNSRTQQARGGFLGTERGGEFFIYPESFGLARARRPNL